jgi:hypothetical protein
MSAAAWLLGAAEPAEGATPLEKHFARSQGFGNSNWGAGYSVAATVKANPAEVTGGTRDTLEADGSLKGWARLAGFEQPIFEVRSGAVTEVGDRTALEVTAYVGSAAIYSKQFESDSSAGVPFEDVRSWPQTFIDTAHTVMAGPIPVHLALRVTGNVGNVLKGSITNSGIEVTSTPFALALLFADASIGFEYCELGVCVGATGGVYTDLKLLEVQTPFRAAANWSLTGAGGVNVDYTLNGYLSLSSLNGSLGAFAEVKAVVYEHRWDTEIFHWDGFSEYSTLVLDSGSHCLIGNCAP